MDHWTNPSVWIIDDDEDDLLLLEWAFLRNTPAIKPLLISDSTDLLARLRSSTTLPKLIVLDLNMPRLNGFELLQQVRQLPRYAHLPIVILTTSSSQHDQHRAFATGANDFLVKPASSQHYEALARMLRQRWVLG